MKSKNSGVYETETCVVFFMNIPDVSKEEVELEMDEYSIEIKVRGKKKVVHSKKEIIPEKATAIFKDGILRVEAPKAR